MLKVGHALCDTVRLTFGPTPLPDAGRVLCREFYPGALPEPRPSRRRLKATGRPLVLNKRVRSLGQRHPRL
jgi:hypothetical protein